MENEESLQAPEKRKRTRNRNNSQPGSSSISARLHPDFDPAKKVTQALLSEPLAQETNLNTANFEDLVKFLDPTVIYEYLDTILKFLNCPKKDISFPNITPFNARIAFLVRIAENHENLKSEALDDKNRQVASEILEVVEKNKNVFQWVHTYEDGNVFRNVLVYKKQFLNETEQDKKADSSKLPLTTRLATTLESMKITTEKKDNIIQPNFKVTFLNTTLRFLKDDNRLILEYPQMSLKEGQYAYSLLEYRDQNGSLGLGFHTLNASLHFAMRELEEKYDFKVSFKNAQNLDSTQIVLEKVPKLVKDIKNKSADVNPSNATTLAVNSLKLPDNPDMIIFLPESFVRASLEKAAEFYVDPCVASTEFKELISVQARFVKSIPQICEQEDLYKLFSPDCRKLLSRIKMAEKHNWKLQVNVGKACTASKTRTITYFKEPVFTKSKPLKSILVKNVKIDNIPSEQTKPRETVTANKTSEKSVTDRMIKINNEKLEKLQVEVNNNTNTKGKTTRKYIDFQSAGLQTLGLDTMGTSDVPTVGKTASDVINALSIKRRNIYAGLATPLESDRAARMMRVMGWEGGALGVRGEGITEPVVPALHIKPGAGLGHIKKIQEEPTSAAELRIVFLNKIHGFITGHEQWTTMPLRHVTKKTQNFMNAAVNAFNNRKHIGLNSTEEKYLISSITNFMMGNPTLHIIFQINEHTKEIYLEKQIIQLSKDPKIKAKTVSVSKTVKKVEDIKNGDKTNTEYINDAEVNNNLEVVKNVIKTGVKNDTTTIISTITVLELAGELENKQTNLKAAKNIAFRVLFMAKMRDFLAEKKELLEIKLDSLLSLKNQRYIENVILEFNRRKRVSKGNELENDVYNEIHNIAGDCFMSFVFNEQKIVLQKKYYKKNTTNTVLEPPKSKDLKNTVVYEGKVNQGDQGTGRLRVYLERPE